MSACLFTEVKQEWVTLILRWVTDSVHYSGVSDGAVASGSRPKPLLVLLKHKDNSVSWGM